MKHAVHLQLDHFYEVCAADVFLLLAPFFLKIKSV